MSTSSGKRKEQENAKQKDSQDIGDTKELLTPMGKLSLNVKAVPYIPKQDVGSQSHLGNEPSRESGCEKNGNSSAENQNDQLPLEKQNGHENEEELRAQIAGLTQSVKQYEDIIGQYQVSEQTRKREVDSALNTAREVVERERREKLDVLSDRKSREEQYEQVTKAMNILQTENEELLKLKRQQDEKLAELTRLKTLIQENGFPNVEQFLMLQRQLDTMRDEFFAERKERERLQSQKDKTKRELEAAQSRIASLQEQVYKYREHIYYLQNKFKQSSPFRPLSAHDSPINRPITASEACKLYGPNATQYINHSLASPMNPVSPVAPTGDPKFSSRSEKKPFSGGRQWQDNRMPKPMTPGDDGWRRNQQQLNRNNNGYYNNNIHRMTSSSSAPSLAAMATEQPADVTSYDKQYGKPGFTRRSRSSLAEDPNKDYGMPLPDWPKQNKQLQGKRFPSPLPSPTLFPSPGTELWSPQQPPGFQKGWPGGQDEIFRFPPSPLTTPTSKSTFDTWPSPSPLVADDKVFSPQTPTSTADESSLFPLSIPTSGSTGEPNFGCFPPGQTNGKVLVCFNCGFHFDDPESHKNHVETCGL